MILYILYKLGIFVSLHTPIKMAYKIAVFIADFHFYLSRRDRGAVLDNLAVICKKSGKENERMARSVFRNFAKYLVDFFRFSIVNEEYVKRNVTVKGKEYLDEALKKGKGVIFASAHLGNWELGGAVASRLGYPVSVIALDHKNKLVNSIFVGQRNATGVRVISIGMGLRKCFDVLKNNETLAILADRDFSEHGITIEFLGKEAVIPKGAATFSIRCGSPIVPVFLLRNPDDSFTFVFEKGIEYSPVGEPEKDIATLTGRVISVLEKYITQHPDQWYMFRRFWS